MQRQSPRFVIISLILIFIVSPLTGIGLAKLTHVRTSTVPPSRTKADFETLLRQAAKTSEYPELYDKTVVKSFKHQDKWWYTLTVKPRSSDQDKLMVIGDFYTQADKMVIVVPPGGRLSEYNISEMGVPYSIIDEVNSQTDGKEEV